MGSLIAKTVDERVATRRWIFSIILSCLALLVSAFTLWQSYLSPYRLIVSSPALRQVNDPYPSLILYIPFFNDGSRYAIISDAANLVTKLLPALVALKLWRFFAKIWTDLTWSLPI